MALRHMSQQSKQTRKQTRKQRAMQGVRFERRHPIRLSVMALGSETYGSLTVAVKYKHWLSPNTATRWRNILLLCYSVLVPSYCVTVNLWIPCLYYTSMLCLMLIANAICIKYMYRIKELLFLFIWVTGPKTVLLTLSHGEYISNWTSRSVCI